MNDDDDDENIWIGTTQVTVRVDPEDEQGENAGQCCYGEVVDEEGRLLTMTDAYPSGCRSAAYQRARALALALAEDA